MMNKPSLITGSVMLFMGFMMVAFGIVVGSTAFDDQEYKEIVNKEDFYSPRNGTYMFELRPTSSLGHRIEVSSLGLQALIFDIKVEELDGTIFMDQKSRITPYYKEMELSSIQTYTFTIDFADEVPLSNFTITILENTFSDTIVAPCCGSTVLIGLGGLLMLIGIILVIVGFALGRTKEVLDDPWNKPQDLYPQPQHAPQPRSGAWEIPPGGQTHIPPQGNDAVFSPNILRPPPGSD